MFTVDTKYILPHSQLQPYVKYFAIRSFDTNGHEVPKSMIADHEMTMVFYLHSKLFGFDSIDKNSISYVVNKNGSAECCFTGIQTTTKGHIIFKGPTTLLNIHFKPAGFFNIFNISPKELVDQMDDTKNILSNDILLLHEQMHQSKTIAESINLLERYLIGKLLSHKLKYRNIGIIAASDLLIKHKGLFPINKLASHVNMTLQTFKVQFTEQVGVNPKYFSRLLRFGLVVNIRLYQPLKSWTEIAYMLGYYDQAHLIKESKEFTSHAPHSFMKKIHPVLENFENKNEIL